MDMHAESLEPNEIENAINAVLFHADHLDDMLKNDFGGRRMIEGEDAAKPTKQNSAYL